jgi:hypothetical protein
MSIVPASKRAQRVMMCHPHCSSAPCQWKGWAFPICVLVQADYSQNRAMSPLLATALEEAQVLASSRGWSVPSEPTIREAQRLLDLVMEDWRAPAVQAEPDGAISLEWEVGAHGWLKLTVAGVGLLEHSAVIEGDEYAKVEHFGDRLTDWVKELLRRLLAVGH